MDNPTQLPNAIVIGAPRSGTTSLYFYLDQHSDIFVPNKKEIHYFTYPLLQKNSNGPGDKDSLKILCNSWEDYKKQYIGVRSQKTICEISPSYLYYSNVSSKIHSVLGNIKIIASLRNPIEKAFSQYMHQVRLNKETLSFYDALMAESVRANQGWSDIWYYAESSLYTQRIVDYFSTFGKKNVKIILAEELFSKTDIVMKDLFSYLGIDPQFNLDISKVYNRSGQPKSKLLASLISQPNRLKTLLKKIIPADTRLKILLSIQDLNTGEKPKIDQRSLRYLQSYFRNDISEIENLIGRPTDWRISG